MLHFLENQFLSLAVSEYGAELRSVRSSDGTEYLWQGDPAFWARRAPHLFPFVGRLPGERYALDGREYPMKPHGVARDRDFRLARGGPGRLEFELAADGDTLAAYPRNFLLRVSYELEENRLDVTYEVENRDGRPMYFGLGAHPGFNVPLTEGLRPRDYRLSFGESRSLRRLHLTKGGLLSGGESELPLGEDHTLPLHPGLFDEDTLIAADHGGEVTLYSELGPHRVTLSFPRMPYLALWRTPGEDAPFLCIEPWCTPPARGKGPAALEERADLIFLEPGGVFSTGYGLTFS